MIDKTSKAELTDAAQALNNIRVNQAEQHAVDFIVHVEMNDIVNGIPE